MGTPVAATVNKALSLLDRVVSDGGRSSLAEIASELGLPLSSAHRLLVTLQRKGFVSRAGKGCYVAGPALIRLGGANDLPGLLRQVGRPILADLSRRTGLTVHLGILENDMVTYLIKEAGSSDLGTREGMQLEAYCSGIGKVLLAHLPRPRIEQYLASGPFPALTPQTITDPARLRSALEQVKVAGFALDEQEFSPTLCCVAAPVRRDGGAVCAAISLSAPLPDPCGLEPQARLGQLLAAAAGIQGRLVPGSQG